ncbi:hypothetical protein AUJ67_04030 [Candidatus Desantisbacteria bacterium CG1_02_49_89]|nr:MAG: hypothetical protein AUJ67_04030 [Candidatus Desantisbacteria bacterium CG1_02_49_89]
MERVWWIVFPVIMLLTGICDWHPMPGLEIAVFLFLFIVPLIAGSRDAGTQKQQRGKGISAYCGRLIETGVLMLVSVVPWIVDTRAFNAALVKTVFSHLLIFTMAAAWFLKILEEGYFRPAKTALNVPVLGFWAWCLISFFISPYKYASMEELYRFSSYFLLFFIVVNNIKEKAQFKRIAATMLAGSFVIALYGILQRLGIEFVDWPSGGRIIASLGNPDFYSGYLCVTIPVSAAMITEGSGSKAARIFYTVLFILQLACLYFTFTRGGWAAVPLALLFLLFLKMRAGGKDKFFADRTRVRIFWASVLVISAGAACVFFCKPFEQAKNKVKTMFGFAGGVFREAPEFLTMTGPYPDSVSPEWIAEGGNNGILSRNRIFYSRMEGTAGVRVTLWYGSWRMFLKNPLAMVFGSGIGTFHQEFPRFRPPYHRFKTVFFDNTHAHSEYLEMLAETGIVGLALFIWIVAAFFFAKPGLEQLDRFRKNLYCGLVAAVFAVLFENLGSVNLRWTSCASLFWVCLGLATALVRVKTDQDTGNKGQPAPVAVVPAVSGKTKPLPANAKLLGYSLSLILLILVYIPTINFLTADIFQKKGAFSKDEPGEWEKAIEYYNKALKYNPVSLEIPYKLAFAYARKGDLGQALKIYSKIAKLAPDYYQVHHNKGYIYYILKNMDPAIKELEIAVRQDWSNDLGFYLLGKAYEEKGDLEKAEKAYHNAIESRKAVNKYLDNNAPWVNTDAYLALAELYTKLDSPLEAQACYEAVQNAESDNPDLPNKLKKLNK